MSRSETTMRCGSGWRRHILLRENCRVILSVLGSKRYRCSYSQLAERRTSTGIDRTRGCDCTNDPSTGKWKGVKSNALNRGTFVSSGRCIMLTPEDTNLPKRIQSLSLGMRHLFTEKHAALHGQRCPAGRQPEPHPRCADLHRRLPGREDLLRPARGGPRGRRVHRRRRPRPAARRRVRPPPVEGRRR